MLRLVALFFALALCPVLARAPQQTPPPALTTPFPTWSLADAPADMKPAITRADLIIIELQGTLLTELTSALQALGESGAVRSCHLDVVGVAHRVGRQSGLAVGRTSDRLRNPTNAPRAWAAPIVAHHAGGRAAGVEGYAVDLGDRLGVLRPIAQRPVCAGCHGPSDRISSRVRAELKDRYPADRGVGYAEGDIRGWFWVEIPRSPAGIDRR